MTNHFTVILSLKTLIDPLMPTLVLRQAPTLHPLHLHLALLAVHFESGGCSINTSPRNH